MKKIFLIGAMTIAILTYVKVNAQQIITMQNGGNISFYNYLDSAINSAQNGDTLYLSGGGFNNNVPISKRLYIYGVGHNPDSTVVTNPTIINGNMILTTGADGSQLSGVYLQSGITFGNSQSNANVNNCTVSRCNLAFVYFYTNAPSNNIFYENIVRGEIYLNINTGIGAQLNGFYNNIIGGFLYNVGPNNIFKNNIILLFNGINSQNIQNSTFENNIFIATLNSISLFTNNTFNNNLFVESLTFPSGSNIGSNNIVNQPQPSIFANQTGNTFSYTQDYHLKISSPGTNAGTDGKDVGIYGGLFPWKDGSLPSNPHIQSKNISGATDQNGNLQINIKVKAQDN